MHSYFRAMTEVIVYHVPWVSIPLAMVTGWALSVLARWLRGRVRR